jgi:phosphoserine phosphatase
LSEPTRSWKDVLSEEPVNEMRAEIYERLMEAQERIARPLYARGVSHAVVSAALDAVDERLSEDQRREDLYLAALAHYVEALGGRLEVRAVFGDEEILVRREPEE